MTLSDGQSGNQSGDGAQDGNQGSNSHSASSWLDFVSEDANRQKVKDVGWKNPDQAIEAFASLESKLGKSITVPSSDAGDEEWGAVFDRLGRPEKPDGYEIRLNDETIPKDMPYDETLATNFKNWAHEAGLTPRQAQVLHDKFVGNSAEAYKAAGTQVQKDVETAYDALTQAWGPDDGDRFSSNVEHAYKAMRNLDLEGAFKAAGFIAEDNTVLNADIVKAMAKVGAAMFKEGAMYGGASSSGPNPFNDGETFNLTEQGNIIRSDPNRAKALIVSAGKNPKDFGITA